MLKLFLTSEEGAAAIEYGLIASLIGLAIVASLTGLGDANSINYDGIQQDVENAVN